MYDYRNDKFYIVEFDALHRIEQNILAYARFQMNELLKEKEAINDEDMISELRSWGMIPIVPLWIDDEL